MRALRTLARRENGVHIAMPDLIRDCLGIEVGMVAETVFEQAHDELDRALPKTAGSIAERLRDWRVAHALPRERLGQLPDLVARAVAECRARTHERIVPLPEGERGWLRTRRQPVPLAYYYGWRLLDTRLDTPGLARRLLTEQLLPADLV